MKKFISLLLVVLMLSLTAGALLAQDENVETTQPKVEAKADQAEESKDIGFFEGLGIEFNLIFALVLLALIFFTVKVSLQIQKSSFNEGYLKIGSTMSEGEIQKLDSMGKDIKDIEKKWVNAILAASTDFGQIQRLDRFQKLEENVKANIEQKCKDYQAGKVSEDELKGLLWSTIGSGATNEAIEKINSYEKEKGSIPPLLNIMLSGLLNLQNNGYNWYVSQEMDRAIENTTSVEFEKVRGGLDWLWAISGGAPMIGLFGTVVGISGAFNEIAAGSKSGGGGGDIIQAFAPKISIALYTTIAGLVIGMAALVAYNILKAKLDTKLSKVATFFTEITNLA